MLRDADRWNSCRLGKALRARRHGRYRVASLIAAVRRIEERRLRPVDRCQWRRVAAEVGRLYDGRCPGSAVSGIAERCIRRRRFRSRSGCAGGPIGSDLGRTGPASRRQPDAPDESQRRRGCGGRRCLQPRATGRRSGGRLGTERVRTNRHPRRARGRGRHRSWNTFRCCPYNSREGGRMGSQAGRADIGSVCHR